MDVDTVSHNTIDVTGQQTGCISGLGNLQSIIGSGFTSLKTNLSGSTGVTVPGAMAPFHLPHTPMMIKTPAVAAFDEFIQLLSRPRLYDLVKDLDPHAQFDEELEEVLLQLADDFVEATVTAACLLAKHRKANTIEVKDVQLHLERHWNLWQPRLGMEELRPYKRAAVTEAHKQRLALIRKTVKKF